MLSIGVFFLGGCATTAAPLDPKDINDCTGLGRLTVNEYDKGIRLFSKNTPNYFQKYDPRTAFREVKLLGCTNIASKEKTVKLFTSHSMENISYGVYYYSQEMSKIFGLFITEASQSSIPNNYAAINQVLSGFDVPNTTAPNNQPAWYIDYEKYSNQPVLVSNARNKSLYGLMSDNTIALTKEQAVYIDNLMQQYWKNE